MDLSEELSGLTTALSDSDSLANSMLLLLLCWCFTALRHFSCHCSWASLLGSLSVLSTHSFASNLNDVIWAASSEFGNYRLCAYASAQSRQNLRYSLTQAVSQAKPSDRKPDPWPL